MTDDILARLDVAHIATAARWTADRLLNGTCATVELTPGDMTLYRIHIVAPDLYWAKGEEWSPVPDEHMVVLSTCSGAAYPWHPGNGHVHPSYAAARWTTDNSRHTGTVVAAFLNGLSVALVLDDLSVTLA